MFHHQHPAYVNALDTERRVRGSRRKPPAKEGELERLLRGVVDGDGAAWSALVARFTPRIRAVARSYRLPPHEVEDVVQTTWLRLIENVGAIREPERLGGWLSTTAQRESLRAIRRGGREQPAEDVGVDEAHTPELESGLVARERRVALAAALGSLTERQRTLLAMVVLEPDVDYRRVSASLDMPVGSIGPTRGRSLARLRRDPRLAAVVED